MHLVAAHQSPLQLLMEVDDLLGAAQPSGRAGGGRRTGTQGGPGGTGQIWGRLPSHV